MSWECVLPFPTDDPSFVLGFEAGGVWRALEGAMNGRAAVATLGLEVPEGSWLVKQTVHASQAEMMLRMAEAKGMALEWRELDETWAEATFRVRDGEPGP